MHRFDEFEHFRQVAKLALNIVIPGAECIQGDTLIQFFQGIAGSFIQAFGLLTVARLAFLTPLPGALGALEAGQVFAFSALGFPAAAAIALILFVRTRDVSLGVLGLVVGGRLASPRQPLNRFSSIIGKDGFL